ncbi:hypothetical protein IFO70_33755 [Phormidium tenue FACHB-886]|nr:hypothetical protein [Phormidium tenue FACHB-886]
MNRKSITNRQHEIKSQSSSDAKAQPLGLVSRLNRLLKFLSDNSLRNSEPRIWQVRDRSGNTYWRAYDLMSGRSLVCSTEQEVRIWLEQVLYRSGKASL